MPTANRPAPTRQPIVTVTRATKNILAGPRDLLAYDFSIEFNQRGVYQLKDILKEKLIAALNGPDSTSISASDFAISPETFCVHGYNIEVIVKDPTLGDHIAGTITRSSSMRHRFQRAEITTGERKGQVEYLATTHMLMEKGSDITLVYNDDINNGESLSIQSAFLNDIRDNQAHFNNMFQLPMTGAWTAKVNTRLTGKLYVKTITARVTSLQERPNPTETDLVIATRLLREAMDIMDCNDPKQDVLKRIRKFLND